MKDVSNVEKRYMKDSSGDLWICYLVKEKANSDKCTIYASTFTGEHKLVRDMNESENEFEIVKEHAEKSKRDQKFKRMNDELGL